MASQALPVGSSSEEWRELLQKTLGEEEGWAVAASLARREAVVNVASSGEDHASGQMSSKKTDPCTHKLGALSEGNRDVEFGMPAVIMEEPDSVLHVVAAVGDSKRHLECAKMIYSKASHLLTTAAQNSKSDTPLHCAARTGNTEMVACLIDLAKGANGVDYKKAKYLVRMRNKRGETALHEAVRFGNVKMVQDLLSADKKLAQKDAEDGTSPLYLACSSGHVKSVELIRKEGKEPSYSGPRGQNALHAAALRNNKEITVKLLNWKKELVHKTDMHGSTPVHFAASAPDHSLQFTVFVFSARNLERYSFGFYFVPPRWLVKLYEQSRLPLPLVKLLESDPTAAFRADNLGSFPVHVAAAADCMVALIILLTKYPACAGLRDANGRSFLHIAVQKKRANAVKFVGLWWKEPFSNQSVMNVQDKNGDTALHLAVRYGEQRIFRYLIGNKQVHINLENKEGKTPMDLAAGAVKPGFYFGLSAPRRILNMLTSANALTGSHRRDKIQEYDQPLDEKAESDKIKEFAQIVGIGSVLVSTATFTAALNMPGGVWTPGDSNDGKKLVVASPPAGTPVLSGSYAFDGFVISNTLAFICATLATFSLVYCGVAAVDIKKRINLVSFSLALLLCSARSFCAAFAFALYMLLAQVAHGTAIASVLMTSFALLDGLWFLQATYVDTVALIRRKTKALLKLGTGFLVNLLYLFWPYLIIGGYLFYDYLKKSGKFHGLSRH